MSATLETVNAFADTLANELASAVKAQDEATVEAFNNIGQKLAEARQAFLDNLNTIEDRFVASIKASTDARSRAMKENGAALDATFIEIAKVIDEVKARYA